MTLSRRSTIKTIGIVGAGSALSGTVLGVNEHEDDERDAESVPDDEETGALRVAHFSPDAPNVDVYVNDQRILADVAYEDVSPYLEIVPGTYTLTITAAGDPETIVYRQQFAVEDGYYTAAAIGELGDGADALDEADDAGSDEESADEASADDSDAEGNSDDTDEAADHEADEGDLETNGGDALDADTFDVLLLVDRTPEEVEQRVEGADAGQIRFVHASPNAPAVDIADADSYVTIFENVEFPLPSGYAGVEAGTITLDVYPAGEAPTPEDKPGLEPEGEAGPDETIEPDDDDEEAGADGEDAETDLPEPVDSVEIDVEAGQAYTAYAIGYLDAQGEQAADDAQDEQAADDAQDEQAADDAQNADEQDVGAQEQDRPEFDIVTLVDATTESDDEMEDDGDYDADEEVDEEPMETDGADDATANETDDATANETGNATANETDAADTDAADDYNETDASNQNETDDSSDY